MTITAVPPVLSIGNIPIPINTYPDGTILINHDDVDAVKFMEEPIVSRAKSLQELYAALYLKDALDARQGPSRGLVLGSVPGGRQDRLNARGDFLFTIKSVAKDINARDFDYVTVLDPHSSVTPALIDWVNVITAAEIIEEFASMIRLGVKLDGVIAPDAGAMKRAQEVADLFSVVCLQAGKKRDIATGALTGFWCEPLPTNGAYLIVDDICDGGGTFEGLASTIHAQYGPDIPLFLYVTHGLFTKGTDTLMTHFRKIITTDTVITPRGPGVITLPVIEKLATYVEDVG